MLTFFGTVVGQCYSVYFREAVPSILVMVLAMLYTMPFSVFTFTKTGTTLFTTPNDFLFQLQFKYLPIAV
jgi:hypothetical protein